MIHKYQRLRMLVRYRRHNNPNEILDLKKLSKRLDLDRRTVGHIAYELGGRRFGNRWRFRWGSVLESFNNAYIETGQKKLLDGASVLGRQADCVQDVSARKEGRPGMEGRKAMGGGTAQNCLGEQDDPYGLREAYIVGKRLSRACEAHHEPSNAC